MGYKFNPFTGNLDTVDSPNGVFEAVEINGDITLDDGGSFTTTLQTVTPTANRTISLPNATGTVGLVAGSSGQVTWNNAGAYAGASTLTYDGSILTTSGRFINSYNATASSPAKAFTGTWFTGGTSTTTKPHFLIEPSGATSTAWSTSGTGFGVNAPSGFAGNLLDLQVNGTSRFKVSTTSVDLGAGGVSLFTSAAANGALIFNLAGSTRAQLDSGGLRLQPSGQLRWNPLSNLADNDDLILSRDAAGTLAQRNGTNAQTFRVYNTYTSGTNYELGKLEWASNVFRIGTEKGSGGGTARDLSFHTDGAERARIDSSGRLLVGLTNANTSGGVLQLSSGITFPATQVASSDPNTLDDYEEGTWTPTISGLTGFDTPSGTYTKIGRMVYCSFWVNGTFNAAYTITDPVITSLPFTAASFQAVAGSAVVVRQDSSALIVNPLAIAGVGEVRMVISNSGTNNPSRGFGGQFAYRV